MQPFTLEYIYRLEKACTFLDDLVVFFQFIETKCTAFLLSETRLLNGISMK